MPLSWNEISDRATAFSHKYDGEKSERGEAQSFLNDFFNVFGVERRRVAVFERHAKRIDGSTGRIDLFWPGMILVEMKSRGEDLEEAFQQALRYLHEIKGAEHPRYILVSDFERFKFVDLEPEIREDMFKDAEKEFEFKLKDLVKNVRLFSLISGRAPLEIEEYREADIKAATLMGKLHTELKKKIGYEGHDLEVLLVRLLFCLFADSTGIFRPNGIFRDYIIQKTSPDGKDLAMHLKILFEILNEEESKRLVSLDQQLAQFPYVNGKLFEEQIRTADFTANMRQELLECCKFDWSEISPAIFGALFQSIMDDKSRRNLGAHYTSEKNILKVIQPLFLDELWIEFHKIRKNPNKLREFHAKLRSLKFLDPACGCGNFLVISYRELRKLEHKVLKELGQIGELELIQVNVDQFYGIELEEWPAQIAQVAMWLVDHQMNTSASRKSNKPMARIPLKTSAKIVYGKDKGNALRIDWNDVVPKEQLSYILGNPPFVGKHLQSGTQKEEIQALGGEKANSLDYVCGWYLKASSMIQNTGIHCAFVSTNSITQGELAIALWSELLKRGIIINFAHRTFRWNNEASGMAAVHCVIMGFSLLNNTNKVIFEYETITGEPISIHARNINPYLIDAPNVLIQTRSTPICSVPAMEYGSKPADDGHLLLTDEEAKSLVQKEPAVKKWIRPFLSAREFLHNEKRWCLWLENAPPNELKQMPLVLERVDKVREFRAASKKTKTVEQAAAPALFTEIRQPEKHYLLVPRHSSEARTYVPLGFFSPKYIVADSCSCVPNALPYHFGIMSSKMHMAWLRTVCGRIKSDFRYSGSLVYNNFPWPEAPTAKQKAAVDQAAEAVLAARTNCPDSSLADLYDPLTMPGDLLKAHQKLDKAVDAAYGKRTFSTESERVAYLFELYQKLATPLLPVVKKSRQKSVSSLRDSGT